MASKTLRRERTKDKPLQAERRAAKQLTKSYRAGGVEAAERVRRVLHHREGSVDLSLSQAQHVVAVERGFKSWKDMLDAADPHAREKDVIRCQFCGFDGPGWTQGGNKCPSCGRLYDAQLAQDDEE